VADILDKYYKHQLNFDDYDELVAYAVNPNINNSVLSSWAKQYLNSDSESVKYLLQNMNTVNSRTLWEIKHILVAIGKPAARLLNDYISDTVTSSNLTAVDVAGLIGDLSSLEKLYELLQSEYPAVRNLTALAVGRINNDSSIEKLKPLLNDTFGMVRKSAIVSIGKLKTADTSIINILFNNLNDTYYYVRFSAVEALQNFDTTIIVPLIFNKIKFAENEKLLLYYLRILANFRVIDAYQSAEIRKLFETATDELIAEYSLRILTNSTPPEISELYINDFRARFGRSPAL